MRSPGFSFLVARGLPVPRNTFTRPLLALPVVLSTPCLFPVQGSRKATLREPGNSKTACASSMTQASSRGDLQDVLPHTMYIVSTPIGNVNDISRRAVSVLANVDIIAAEDTRRTGMLLKRILPHNVARTSVLVSCHAHNWQSRAPNILNRLRGGASVAIVSDAGTPSVSDPGAELASIAIAAGIKVVPVPGACAALAALVCARLPPGIDVVVLGFVPRSGKLRKDSFATVSSSYRHAAVVLYEAPHRLIDTLRDLALLEESFGARYVCLGRELTKKYEEFLHFDSCTEAFEFYSTDRGGEGKTLKGEFTLVLGPCPSSSIVGRKAHGSESDISGTEIPDSVDCDTRRLVDGLVQAEVPTNVIAKAVAASTELSRKAVYAYATELKTQRANST